MSTFAVAAFHESRLPSGADRLEAAIWIRADGLDAGGVPAALRIWTPAGASVTALREVAPAVVDLIAAAAHLDDRTLEVGAGCWTDGPREYELALSLPARAAGVQMLAARVMVVAGEAVVGQALIAVTWTDAAVPAAAVPAPGAFAPATVAVTTGDLPTGASPQPRHTAHDVPGGGPCPGCGTQAGDGDRYCEACGHELV